jgi:hypothetical protein
MAHSSHRRQKGCGLCSPHKHRGNGRAVRDPWQTRRVLGSKRRAGRHDVPADQHEARVAESAERLGERYRDVLDRLGSE